MKYYHTCAVEYFRKQYQNDEWIPHYGATWLAETRFHSIRAIHTKLPTLTIAFELDPTEVEDHSDMSTCKRLGVKYYIHRGKITADKIIKT